MYDPMTALSSLFVETNYVVGDSGYDDYKLYDVSRNRGFALVYPVQRYEHTPPPQDWNG